MDYSNLTLEDLRKLTEGNTTPLPGLMFNNGRPVSYGNGSIWYNPAWTAEQAAAEESRDTKGINIAKFRAPRGESWTYGEVDPNNELAGWNQTLTPNASGGFDVGDVRNYDNTANRKKWDMIKKASLAAFGGLAGAGSLGMLSGAGAGTGAIGGGLAEGAATGGLGSGLTAGGSGLGFSGTAGLGGSLGGGALGTGLVPGAAASAGWGGGLGSALAGVSTGVGGSGLLGGLGSAAASAPASSLGGVFSDIAGKASSVLGGIKDFTGMSTSDLLKLGVGAAGLASQGSSTPDYAGLARQQADLENQMLDKQTIANRPNQTNAAGDTSSWTKDPATGQWTQQTAYSTANQGKFDAIQAQQAKLMEQIKNQKALTAGPLQSKLDLSGIGQVGTYKPSPYTGGF